MKNVLTGRVRWGVLGTSRIATKHTIPAMRQSGHCRVVAIASRTLDKARVAAHAAGIERYYGSYEELLTDKDVEAVYVPLPNTMHVEWSLNALAAGKHVLCEKPIATTAAEAQKLVEARNRTGLLIEEGFPFVNHPQWDFIRRAIKAGEIGKVRAVTAVIGFNANNPEDLRNNPEQGGGSLYDVGCYPINACRIVFDAEPVAAVGLFEMDPVFRIDRLTSAILAFPQGHATLTASTQAGPATDGSHQHLGILGSAGWMRAEFPFSHPVPTSCRVYIGDASAIGSLPTRERVFPALNQYQLQAECFSRLVRGETAAAWPIESSVANMRVIDALFRSRTSGAWQSI
ncbi:MAG: Gfo/Idh/MocA family oxidoreductase [Alphaproteobacteria bacterium]|nr:Gfo/Idh/MocA family oxidoreductase [Alphaproteobacteria bacterium]